MKLAGTVLPSQFVDSAGCPDSSPQVQESSEDVGAGAEDVTAAYEVSAAEISEWAEVADEQSHVPLCHIPLRRRLSGVKLVGPVLPSQLVDSAA